MALPIPTPRRLADAASAIREDSYTWHVIFVSSLGMMISWYDFYLFDSFAPILAAHFFPTINPTLTVLATLATFGASFAARPLGALLYGRFGDMVGRKYAFLVALLLMGGATGLIGLMPTYQQIGLLAPVELLVLRVLQGLALGGIYGGAVVHVAENVPDARRGFYTGFVQATATLGLLVSMLVVLGVRAALSPQALNSWGWRIPFLAGAVLFGIVSYIRFHTTESPLFAHLRAAGQSSRVPLRESLGSRANGRKMALALFGALAGQAVVWYTGQFYITIFLQSDAVGLPFTVAHTTVATALALALPFFVLFGALSDRIGRKPIMMAGNALAALAILPIFQAIRHFAGPLVPITDATGAAMMRAVHPNTGAMTLLVFALLLLVAMVYGPIAAFLVESFPARIRYTSFSLPYHVGNGYFGGFLPLIAVSLVARTGNPFAGLWFPIAIAALTFVVGTLWLKETRHVSIHAETEAIPATFPMTAPVKK